MLTGSSIKPSESPETVAAHELQEETGIVVDPNRVMKINARQIAATLSTHKAELFAVKLNDEEIKQAEEIARKKTTFGVEEDTEKTYLEVKTLREIIADSDMDWSMLGMLMEAINK